MQVSYDSLFIGGEWVRPSSGARIDVTSASTEEPIGSVPEGADHRLGTSAQVTREPWAGGALVPAVRGDQVWARSRFWLSQEAHRPGRDCYRVQEERARPEADDGHQCARYRHAES